MSASTPPSAGPMKEPHREAACTQRYSIKLRNARVLHLAFGLPVVAAEHQGHIRSQTATSQRESALKC